MPAVSLVSFVVKLLFDYQGRKEHNGKNQPVGLQVSSAVFQITHLPSLRPCAFALSIFSESLEQPG